MTQDSSQLPPAPAASEVNAAWLSDAIAQLKTRGEAVSRLGCMSLSVPLFNDLCGRILAANGEGGLTQVIEWLHGQTPDAPSRSAVYRFAGYLREEYRLARSLDRRRAAKEMVSQLAEGDSEAMQLGVNMKLTERLADLLDRTDNLEDLDPKTLDAAVKGVRIVSQTVFDKRKMDKAIQRANVQIEALTQDNQLKAQKIADYAAKQAAAAAALNKVAVKGGQITPADIAEVRSAIFG